MAEKTSDENREFGVDEKDIGVRRSSPDSSEGKDGKDAADVGLDAEEVEHQYTQEETRRILRKIDYRLIPLLGVLYL